MRAMRSVIAGPLLLMWCLTGTQADCAPRSYFEAKNDASITLNVFIDRSENEAFLKAEEDAGYRGFVYSAVDRFAAGLEIQPSNTDLLDVWKRTGASRADMTGPWTRSLFEERAQFAPLLLVVDLTSDKAESTRIANAYLEVRESSTDLQPYLYVSSVYDPDCGEEAGLNPTFDLFNKGWGPVQYAKVTYSFGNEKKSGDERFTAEIGTFENSATVSVIDGLRSLKMDTDSLGAKPFKCDRKPPACLLALSKSGLLGDASTFAFADDGGILSRISGTILYQWVDSAGIVHHERSPFSVDIPIVQFEPQSGVDCGGAGAVERGYKTVRFSLDRKDYRIPLSYSGDVKPHQERRFGLALVADKSSRHVFKVVLELADGSTVSSPTIDFLYFVPRFPQTN
jgi:hypothetical protein